MRPSLGILALGIALVPVFVAGEASARQGALVAGTHVAERPSGVAAWTPVTGGHMHPGWQLTCPDGCALETSSGRIRLDQTTTIREIEAPLVQRDSGTMEEVSSGFEILEGGVTAEIAGKHLVLLQSTRGAQLVIKAGHSGRLVSRMGRDAFAAMEGDADLRTPGERWSTLPASSVVFARAGKVGEVHALSSAPAWAQLKPSDAKAAVIDARGKVVSGAMWTPDPNAVAYRFEIARDSQFTHPVRSGETEYCFLTEKLPVGTYFVRIRAIDVNALETRFSPTRSLRIVAAAGPDA